MLHRYVKKKKSPKKAFYFLPVRPGRCRLELFFPSWHVENWLRRDAVQPVVELRLESKSWKFSNFCLLFFYVLVSF